MYLGINQVQQTSHKDRYYIAYSVIIGVMFLAWLLKGLASWRHEPLLFPRPRSSSGQFMQKQGASDANGVGNYSGMRENL